MLRQRRPVDQDGHFRADDGDAVVRRPVTVVLVVTRRVCVALPVRVLLPLVVASGVAQDDDVPAPVGRLRQPLWDRRSREDGRGGICKKITVDGVDWGGEYEKIQDVLVDFPDMEIKKQ